MRLALTTALLCAGAALIAQSRTTISMEILSDGTCSVAVRSTGARSEISYMPKTPGRCPIPATVNSGEVRLEVLLPPGSAIPRDSMPRLQWTMAGDRPHGVADLDAAPAFLDVMPAPPPIWRRPLTIVVVLIVGVLAAWGFTRGRVR